MSTETARAGVSFVPPPFPDEILHSWLARLARLNALGASRNALQVLFGTRNVIPSVDLPTHLNALHQRLGTFSPFSSARHIVEASTVYPYHRPFLAPPRDEAAVSVLLHCKGPGLKTAIGRVANRFGAHPPLRYCPECVVADTHHHGAPYGHRIHQLPGVACCTIHDRVLLEFAPHAATPDRQGLQALHCHFLRQTCEPRGRGTLQQQRFARLSTDLLRTGLPAVEPDVREAWYRNALQEAGFCAANGRIAFARLAHTLRQRHDDFRDFEHRERLLSTPRNPLAWLHSLVCRPSRAVHPICHLLLIDWLYGSIDAFARQLLATSPPGAPLAPEIPACAGTDPGSWAHESALRDTTLSCRRAGQALGLSVTTVVTLRRQLGVPVSERRKKLDDRLLNVVRRDLIDLLHPRVIAARHCVSLSTVYRVRALLPPSTSNAAKLDEERDRRRTVWQRARAENASRRWSDVRATEPAAYAWLYRHDRDWLRDQRPVLTPRPASAKSSVDWYARDARLCTQLQEYIAVINPLRDRPRISKTSMLRALGPPARRLERLPCLRQGLDQLAETLQQYQRLRAEWAIADLLAAGLPPLRWRVMRTAGLRRCTQALRLWIDERIALAQCEAAGNTIALAAV